MEVKRPDENPEVKLDVIVVGVEGDQVVVSAYGENDLLSEDVTIDLSKFPRIPEEGDQFRVEGTVDNLIVREFSEGELAAMDEQFEKSEEAIREQLLGVGALEESED